MKGLIINKKYFVCQLVIFLALISNQSPRLFGISGGIVFKFLYFSKYIAVLYEVIYAMTMKNRTFKDREIKSFFMTILVPLFLIMIVNEIIAIFVSPIPTMYGVSYWTRSVYRFADKLCIYFAFLGTLAICGKKAISSIIKVLLADGIIIFACALFNVGISGVISSVMSIFNGLGNNYFEVHELTFSIGLIIIYYLYYTKKSKNDKLIIFILMIYFLLGDKRIALAGIIIAGLFSYLVSKKGLSKKMLIIVGTSGVFICMLYLLIIYNSEFFVLLENYNINGSGREIIYRYFTNRTVFGPEQFGWGLAGVNKVIENWNSAEVMYMHSVSGVHNDILQIYITYGFFGAIVWYSYNLLYVPIRLFDKYGKRIATIYTSLLLYIFVTYLTDNTEGYFTCQVLLLLIPMADYIEERNNLISRD